MISIKIIIILIHLCILNSFFLLRSLQYYEDQSEIDKNLYEHQGIVLSSHHHKVGATTTITSSSSSSSSSSVSSKSTLAPKRKQRIVIIGGPHKTGSTSMHENLVHWIHTHDAFSNWKWPVPKDHPNDNLAWGFGHLAWTFVPKKCETQTNHVSIFPGDWNALSCEMIQEIYQEEIDTQWRAGYDLVIGTEEFDFISQNRATLMIDVDQVINTIIPWKHDPHAMEGEVYWVVKYRSPRASHLLSGWHQCCADSMTFLEFLNKYPKLTFAAYFVDSLFYVERLLQNKDIHVVLMGVSDLRVPDTEHNRVDASAIVACNVLEVPCDEHDIFTMGKEEKPIVSNVKTGFGNMGKYFSDDMIPDIEHVFQRRDCAYAHLLSNDNLQLLYAHDLVKTFSDCLARGDTGITRETMIISLLHIAYGQGLPEGI
jgi:hypothetical protein